MIAARSSVRAPTPWRSGPVPGGRTSCSPREGVEQYSCGDPEPEPDELRRRPGLERLERLGEPLRRQLRAIGEGDDDAERAPPPERDADDGADGQPGHLLGHPVVERAPQRAGGRQRLDLCDRHHRPRYGGTRTPSGAEISHRRGAEAPSGRADDLPGAPVLASDPRLLPERARRRDRRRRHRQGRRRRQRHRLPDRPRHPRPDRPDRLLQAGLDDLHDHRPPPQHQTRDHLARGAGDAARAGPERQLPAIRLPAADADRRRRLRHRRDRRLQLRLRRRRRPRRSGPPGRPGDRRRRGRGAANTASGRGAAARRAHRAESATAVRPGRRRSRRQRCGASRPGRSPPR